MLKNYIAVLIRYLLKNKQYVVLNIAGLAIGMTTVMLIALFVRHEFSYDRFHKDSHLLYRVLRETRSEQGQSTYSERLSGALGLVIREEMPEVNQVVRLHRRDAWIKYQDRDISLSHPYRRASPASAQGTGINPGNAIRSSEILWKREPHRSGPFSRKLLIRRGIPCGRCSEGYPEYIYDLF